MILRVVLLSALALATLSACDAVTDPLKGEPDPRPILGEWFTPRLSGEPELYGARIQGGGAPLFGEFRFPLHGRTWYVQFRDARWNGRVLSFVTKTDFGFVLPDTTVHWSATRVPGRGRPGQADWDPARLRLAAHTVDGLAFTWEYFRFEDLVELLPELEDAPIR